MPFGIPTSDPPIAEMLRLLDANNTSIQNASYDIAFAIGQHLSFYERMLGQTHRALAGKIRSACNRNTKRIGEIVTSIASAVGDRLNDSAVKLAQAQTAIAMTPPGARSPDIPAADIRRPAATPVPKIAQALVSNVIHEANKDVSDLLHLLYLLNLTPAQVRRYLTHGTIPEIYLCPDPAAHEPSDHAPPVEIVTRAPLSVPSSVYDPTLAKPDLAEVGFWEDG